MITLQQYLNQKYPTKEEKERVKEIDTDEIRKELGAKHVNANVGSSTDKKKRMELERERE